MKIPKNSHMFVMLRRCCLQRPLQQRLCWWWWWWWQFGTRRHVLNSGGGREVVSVCHVLGVSAHMSVRVSLGAWPDSWLCARDPTRCGEAKRSHSVVPTRNRHSTHSHLPTACFQEATEDRGQCRCVGPSFVSEMRLQTTCRLHFLWVKGHATKNRIDRGTTTTYDRGGGKMMLLTHWLPLLRHTPRSFAGNDRGCVKEAGSHHSCLCRRLVFFYTT